MQLHQENTSSKLRDAEGRIRSLREERGRLARIKSAAVEAAKVEEDSGGPAYDSAKAAADALREVETRIEQATEDQVELLKSLNPGGLELGGGSGWELAAQRLSLADGNLRVDVPARSLMAQAPVAPTQSERPPAAYVNSGVDDLARTRWIHPILPPASFGASGDLVATDFTVTPQPVSGEVEIAPATATQKATLAANVALATPTAQTYAVVVENIPSLLFNTRQAVQAFLGREVSRALNDRIDEAVVDTLEAAAPPSGLTGANLVEQIRNAVADMRDLGGSPSHLVVDPATSAQLDLTQDDAGSYVFSVRMAGDASPIWNLQVRESPTITGPTLIDAATLGVGYWGDGSVLVDPYTSKSNNMVEILVEINAVPVHVRNITQGAFVIAPTS